VLKNPAKWPDVADPPQISPDDKVRFKSPAITRFLSESRPLFASVVQNFSLQARAIYIQKVDIPFSSFNRT
jgi:hypothetical protein